MEDVCVVGNLSEVDDGVDKRGAGTALALHAPKGINAGGGAQQGDGAR